VPSWQTTVVPLLGGTTTVVFCGGGGLLLLMQPDSMPIKVSETNRAFIPIPPGDDDRNVVSRTPLAVTVVQTRECA
jgi:hypothetical protein